MEKRIVLYEHAGSSNHGCEAIIRSTVKIFDDSEVVLASFSPDEDIYYGLNNVCKVIPCANPVRKDGAYYLSRLFSKFFKDERRYWKLSFKKFLNSVSEDKIYLSTGGDNYCYKTKIQGCIYLNSEIKKRGGKTVLWGVSIEPDIIADPKVTADLKTYDLIVARESITYNALIDNGISKTIFCPDPAFLLECADVEFSEKDEKRGIVGINISPMIIENAPNAELIYENYKGLMNYIIQNTDYTIAMIPHVVWEGGDDRIVIKKLCDEFVGNERIVVVEDNDCCIQKGYISKCKFFIGARTHTTIAAYSLNIPTIVVGYSVKAKGIARDIFESDENYVLPVQLIEKNTQLIERFKWMQSNEEEMKNALSLYREKYKEHFHLAKEQVYDLH